MLYRKALSRSQIREIDRRAIEELGIPGTVLMENAGREAAAIAIQMLKEKGFERAGIVCGMGNNGGDGFVVARYLIEKSDLLKLDLKAFVLGPMDRISGDAAEHLRRLQKIPAIVESIASAEPLRRFAAAGPLLWIDAIFGTGLSRPVDGLARQAIEALNDSEQPVLAIDIPSGLDADTGEILGAAVKAETTVTFVRSKIGFERGEGPRLVGRVVVAPIGIPEEFIERRSR